MTPGQIILAYHGCDITVRDRLVRGQLDGLRPSSNGYDWLGKGVYLFEGDPDRALRFAESVRDHPRRFLSAKPIVNPTVVGVVLGISRCWDMTTIEGRREYQSAFSALQATRQMAGRCMPVNDAGAGADDVKLLRALDCAVFNIGHETRERQGEQPHELVRASFHQGQPIRDGTDFRTGSHIQLALRDPSCVVGWFLPRRIGSALLNERELADADRAMSEAIKARTASKPRVLAPR
ncbi:hypothetical protein ACNI65_03110 [Roseateles sp. So40a]|uniref:hypothetical protein n=1 Tax=Roseateles sp. So40a TaxID=3400226 RepID=UPI003A8769BD